MKKIIFAALLSSLVIAAHAQSTVGQFMNSDAQSNSGANNQGVSTVFNSYGTPYSFGTSNARFHTNQAYGAAPSYATPAVIGTCQKAGKGIAAQIVGGGVSYAGEGSTEPICGAINTGTLVEREQKATGTLKSLLKATNCMVEDVADIYETAAAQDSSVTVCPPRLKRADREAREQRAQAILNDTPRPVVATSQRDPMLMP